MFSKLNQLEKYNKILKSDIEQYSLQKGSVINSVKKDFKNQFNIPEDYDDLWFFKLHYNKDLDIKRRIEGLDFKTFLPEHALVRVDRNSMLFGLECRVPFLSNRMIELAFSIDPKYKFHNQNLKFILKNILEKYSSFEYAFSNKKGLTISSSLRKAYYKNWDRNENISMIKRYIEG